MLDRERVEGVADRAVHLAVAYSVHLILVRHSGYVELADTWELTYLILMTWLRRDVGIFEHLETAYRARTGTCVLL